MPEHRVQVGGLWVDVEAPNARKAVEDAAALLEVDIDKGCHVFVDLPTGESELTEISKGQGQGQWNTRKVSRDKPKDPKSVKDPKDPKTGRTI
jgi:hypothetical protein